MAEKKYEVKFDKPVNFEGKEYTSLDLSGLADLKSTDLFAASRDLAMRSYINPKPESDPEFCCTLAQKVTPLPLEFFSVLPIKEAVKIRDVVQTFFQGRD